MRITTLLTLFLASVSANLKIMTPVNLRDSFKNATIPAKLGNFGSAQLGTKRIGYVIFPTENNTFGCDKFEADDFPAKQHYAKEKNGTNTFFIMVKRG
jgi:hypothetical protein